MFWRAGGGGLITICVCGGWGAIIGGPSNERGGHCSCACATAVGKDCADFIVR